MKKTKTALIKHRVRPTLVRLERNIPHSATIPERLAHKREAGIVAAVMEEVLQALALDHSIIVVLRPEVSESSDIANATHKTTIRAAFILAEGQKPGIVAAPQVKLSEAFEYDTLEEVSSDPIAAIITPEGKK